MCKAKQLNPAAMLDTPKAPKRVEAPKAQEAPPTPPPAPVKEADVVATPDPNSQAAQSAAADAYAEAQQRKKKSTFLTGSGGISAERFGNAGDIKKADLLGGGR